MRFGFQQQPPRLLRGSFLFWEEWASQWPFLFFLGLRAHCGVSSGTAVQLVLSVPSFLVLHHESLRKILGLLMSAVVDAFKPCMKHCLSLSPRLTSKYRRRTFWFSCGIRRHCSIRRAESTVVCFVPSIPSRIPAKVSWAFGHLLRWFTRVVQQVLPLVPFLVAEPKYRRRIL